MDIEKRKRTNKIILIIAFALFSGLFLMIYSLEKSVTPTESKVDYLGREWATLTHAQKQGYLTHALNTSPDDLMILQSQASKAIKDKFQFPNEVEFDWGASPRFNGKGMIIDDTELGRLYAHGTGTAKNAYGMESAFQWNCRIIYTTEVHQVDQLNVFQ